MDFQLKDDYWLRILISVKLKYYKVSDFDNKIDMIGH